MKIRHKVPCRECPWRRSSPPGWLGPNTVEQYSAPVRSGVLVPCHLDPNRSYCAGSAVEMRNSCTLPRDPDMAAQVLRVKPSEDVFRFPTEFEAHHRSGVLHEVQPSKKPARARMRK